MRLPIYQIDAFTDKVFKGNPAAVCQLTEWLPDETLQNIAAENNLSETAFIIRGENDYQLRWFTPACEVDLCGHATLAAGFTVLNFLEPGLEKVDFDSPRAGALSVSRDKDWLVMDFPVRLAKPSPPPDNLKAALMTDFEEVYQAEYMLVTLKEEKAVQEISPDFNEIAKIDTVGIIVTARASENTSGVDFVSRFFAPRVGINEDPVTGSAHCTLVPFWADRLGKKKLKGYQASKRGGLLLCELKGDRVSIAGQAVCYLKGEIDV